MKLVKTLVAAAAIAVSSFASQASEMSIGGVSWNPAGDFDFTAETSESFFQSFNSGTGTLTGFGKIITVQGNANYCSGCELLFKFSATVSSNPSLEGQPLSSFFPNSKIMASETRADFSTWLFEFNPSIVNIVVASAGSFNGTLSSVTGTSWLNMALTGLNAAAVFKNTDVTLSNPLYGTSNGILTALNDGALAAGAFVNSLLNGQASVDATFGSRTAGTKPNFTDKSNLVIRADTVPEPSSLAVLGLGLLGLACVARRKQAK